MWVSNREGIYVYIYEAEKSIKRRFRYEVTYVLEKKSDPVKVEMKMIRNRSIGSSHPGPKAYLKR